MVLWSVPGLLITWVPKTLQSLLEVPPPPPWVPASTCLDLFHGFCLRTAAVLLSLLSDGSFFSRPSTPLFPDRLPNCEGWSNSKKPPGKLQPQQLCLLRATHELIPVLLEQAQWFRTFQKHPTLGTFAGCLSLQIPKPVLAPGRSTAADHQGASSPTALSRASFPQLWWCALCCLCCREGCQSPKE